MKLNDLRKLADLQLAEAKQYGFDGDTYGMPELMKLAVGKDIFQDGKRWHYNLVMREEMGNNPATVFPLTKAQYDKLKKPDMTSPKTMQFYLKNVLGKMTADMQFNKQVDFNSAIRAKNINKEDYVALIDLALKHGAKPIKGALKVVY